jgi:hypothetical protein
MPKNNADKIMGWDYHPQIILMLSFCIAYVMGDGGLSLALIISSAVAMPFIAIALFLPYLAIVMLFAALLSLPQAIR